MRGTRSRVRVRGRHGSHHSSSTAVSEETFNVDSEAQSHTTPTTQKTRKVLLVRSQGKSVTVDRRAEYNTGKAVQSSGGGGGEQALRDEG